jgi:phosphoribosyl 1,2-cyclic phosphodiesterase
MRVVSLGSGSSGNSLLVEAGPQRRTKLLVDAGLSGRVLKERLWKVGVLPSQLQAVLVTHEHSDHVIGLPLFVRRYNIPVMTDPRTYAIVESGLTSGLWRTDSGALVSTTSENALSVAISTEIALAEGVGVGAEHAQLVHTYMYQEEELPQKTDGGQFLPLDVGSSAVVGDISVTSFPISHDVVAPCGYLLSAGGCRVCVVTDSGEVTPAMLEMMKLADLLVLESNHDRERLIRGPYPQSLKNRILSSTGHLSNDQAADAVLRTWRSDSVRWLWLAHLSRTNNTPSLALKSMRVRLQAAHANLAQIHIAVSPPGMGNIWDSTQLWHAPSLWEMGDIP